MTITHRILDAVVSALAALFVIALWPVMKGWPDEMNEPD